MDWKTEQKIGYSTLIVIINLEPYAINTLFVYLMTVANWSVKTTRSSVLNSVISLPKYKPLITIFTILYLLDLFYAK